MFSFLQKLIGQKKEASEIERRHHKRYRLNRSIDLEFYRKFHKMPKLGQGRNISKTGIRFATPFYVKNGEKIDLTLHLSKKYRGKKKVQLKAKVVNFIRPRGASRYRAGCRFLKMDEQTKQEIEKFIGWIESRQTVGAAS